MKPSEIKILYICDFDLTRATGKDRATRQKLKAMKSLVNELTVLDFSGKTQMSRSLLLPILEFKAMLHILLNRPDFVISRGHVGILFQSFSKLLAIPTAREIHSNALEQLQYLPYTGLKRIIIGALTKKDQKTEKMADMRIFNHPQLLNWYQENVRRCHYDFSIFNGYDPSSASILSREEALEKFNLDRELTYLVFVGSASVWHGAKYLVDLQKEFNKNGDNIKVVCGGGSLREYDKDGLCINITPLDSCGCADLIRAATACLLPVNNNRTSPGSPLKLYDYIANDRYVITQSNTIGYSDEVKRYNVGISVDFTTPFEARKEIIEFLNKMKNNKFDVYPACPVTWTDRIKVWLDNLCYYKSQN